VPEDPPIPARFEILLELLREGPLRASDLVDPTDLTLQGVSYNLEQLEDEGLVRFDDDRAARITEKGIEALHDHFLGLKAFVDYALEEMLHVEECVALADEALDPGDQVGLFMEEGELVARREDSPSTGRVREGGARGEIVTVTGLTGVVDLDPGTVHVVRLPPPAELPAPEALAGLEAARTADVVATEGLEARVLVDRAGLAPDRGPIDLAAEHVARSAAQRGLDALVVAAWDDAGRVAEALREGEGVHGEELTVHVHDLHADA
jgi:putative transcriptional regulator